MPTIGHVDHPFVYGRAALQHADGQGRVILMGRRRDMTSADVPHPLRARSRREELGCKRPCVTHEKWSDASADERSWMMTLSKGREAANEHTHYF